MKSRSIDNATGQKLLALKDRIVADFNSGNWEDLGLVTGMSDIIDGHHRLLRSLSWGDEDYSGNVSAVLRSMIERDSGSLRVIESYLDEKYPGESTYISAKPPAEGRKITFAPYVFQVPDGSVERDLCAVMMPFALEFAEVFASIAAACTSNRLRCLRADNIWEDSVIAQDIFSLIFRAEVVIVDFSGRNPNVMYETGIAHTLGKHVIPIAQSIDDVPFDMRHHRVLTYLQNAEGRAVLERKLTEKLKQFAPAAPSSRSPAEDADDEIPF